MKIKKLYHYPSPPSQCLKQQPVDSGEHLAIITNARKKQHHLLLEVDVHPDGHDTIHRLAYSIIEDWRWGGEFVSTLTDLGALLRQGSYFDPSSLEGLPLIVNIDAIEDEDGQPLYKVKHIRLATEREATRTDFDEEDSSDFDDVFSPYAHNDEFEDENELDSDEDDLALEDDFIWED